MIPAEHLVKNRSTFFCKKIHFPTLQKILSLETVGTYSEASNEIEKVCPKSLSQEEVSTAKLSHTKSQIITGETLDDNSTQTQTKISRQRANVEHSLLQTSKTLVMKNN